MTGAPRSQADPHSLFAASTLVVDGVCLFPLIAKDKRMFSPANAAQFSLLIPTVRNDFKVLAFDGTETLSSLYAIRVELVSEYPDFDLESLLGQPAFLEFGLNGEGIHGCIGEVFVGEAGKRLTRYQLTLVPALHYLQFSHNQRIFQHLTVPQIIDQVFKQHGIQADAFTFHVDTSPVREYCTQYGESDFGFIQRLCSEDGIAWHHQHSQDGHQLVFTADQTYFPTLGNTPYQQGAGLAADHPVVNRFAMSFSTRTSTTTRRGYDLKRPSRLLESGFTAEFSPALEDYRYPVLLDTEQLGKQLARQALERHRVDYQVAEGASDQPTLRCGHFFSLTEHPRAPCNDMWLLLSVTHSGKQPQSLEEAVTHDVNPEDGFTQGYRNTFSAIPWDALYRPPMPAPRKPLVAQTARVTGPVGEEIFCDEYGRVKVEFHWDRAELNSDKSSCWLRVSSNWAGERFGSVTIPRVGMEVVVTYLEGNPDHPLITGCVSNKVMAVPYSLPEHKTRTVLRSHSSPASGGYNELSIEDRAGQEKIYLRAQRDLEQKVEHDAVLDVGNERRETIKGNSIVVLEAEDQHTVTADRKVQLKANDYLQVAQSSHTRIGETLVVDAGQQVHLKSGADLILNAGESITLKGGGQHIVIGPGGIFSSTEIQLGGAPAGGTAANPLSPNAQSANAAGVLPLVVHARPSGLTSENRLVEHEIEEEEEEEVEIEQLITLRIGMFFDGTGNNRDNSEKVRGCFARDVNLAEAAPDIVQFCAKHGFDGNGGAPDDSFGNDSSNVAKLYELYNDDSQRTLAEDESEASLPVYVEGIGTSSTSGDSRYSGGTGLGAQGVRARVEESPSLLLKVLKPFQENNPDKRIKRIEFDIFGFSRGAAAARDFANEVLKGGASILSKAIPAGSPGLTESFAWRPQTDLCINYIGIFDTVAAIADWMHGDFSGNNANNPGINIHLAPNTAKKIVHLVAKDERRYNFSLNKAGDADIALPGVHSDLGGGYLPDMVERVLLSKPSHNEISWFAPTKSSTSYKEAQADLAKLEEQYSAYNLPLEISTWHEEIDQRIRGDRNHAKRIHAAVISQREVRSDLALVYLRIMRKLAVQNGVPFQEIPANNKRLALPAELLSIAEKLTAYAIGETDTYGLNPAEESLLYRQYVHLSSHWNPATNMNANADVAFINRPGDNDLRTEHPNE
jgi:type VI secretion system secreted protein VgrG